MRAFLAALAVAGAMAAGCVPLRAQVMTDERCSVAMMSASDVVRALHCAPPFGCVRRRSKPRRAVARDPSKRAAIVARLHQRGIGFQ